MMKVILDMDTGVDDALAIMLALNSPELEVLGITIVGGNVSAAQSARNTAAVLSHMGGRVRERYPNLPPVATGKSLKPGTVDASDVHGPDGLGGVCDKYFNPRIEIRPNAMELLCDLLRREPSKTVTLITTGPLINVAHWITQCPEVVRSLKEIISMGGVFFNPGNRSIVAEFNIHCDPASARKVVEFCRTLIPSEPNAWKETIPLTFVGLDVTHQVRFRHEILEKALRERPHDCHLVFLKEITAFYMNFYNRNEGLDGCYLHDPLAVAYAFNRSFCNAKQFHVEVEDKGDFTAGMTVADNRPTRLFKDKMKEVTWVCEKVQADRFEKIFLERVLYF